jgi:predicted DNA-binding transcriptional regulator AlpA
MKTTGSCTPETATGTKLAAEITDKRGFAARWGFSIRHIDNLLAQGCPHLKIGKRRVRLVVSEADEWMKRTFATQRRRPVRTAASVGVEQG